MAEHDIGDEIRFRRDAKLLSGRVVGREDAKHRRGYVDGWLYVVDLGNGDWVEVHSRDLVQEQPA